MKLIVISPHSDDETLGAGGTILKYKDLGYKIYWLNITNMKEKYGVEKKTMLRRQREIKKVIAAYRFDGFFDLGLRAKRLEQYPIESIIGQIADVFKKVEPNIVIYPYKYDVHSDHQIISGCTNVCTKAFRHPYIEKALMMEVISETCYSVLANKFSPSYFVDISNYVEKKIKIMKIYEGEMGKDPFPRSEENIKALAKYRGSMVGRAYVEAFMLVKSIE